MTKTEQEFEQEIKVCRDIFGKKSCDYGTSWRILRLPSLTDQIFIKANRIRSIEESGVNKIGDDVRGEYIAMVNYAVMALIQMELADSDEMELPTERALELYDKHLSRTVKLMLDKNHDYGEAWRDMRVSSMTDLILMKLKRIKQIEDNQGHTLISEGVEGGYMDIINYSLFCLIRLNEHNDKQQHQSKTFAMIKETTTNKIIRIIARWFVGLVFIFSSFTKGVDPLGTAYKVEEYMTAWSFGSISFEWALPLAPLLSMTLITLEFLVGVLLLTGSFRKLSAWLLALMMLFFTFTTLYDAITNKVSDCGCFGDFLKLTNWQTFWKNVVLDVPTLYIFLTRRWPRKNRLESDIVTSLAAIAAMVIFGMYNINNEPVLDFRPWKVGNVMMANVEEGLETTNEVTYKNKETGEFKTMDSKQLIECYAADPAWGDKWEWVGTSTVSPYEIVDPKNDSVVSFPIMDAEGEDHTLDIIGAADGPILICTIHHIKNVNERGIKAINEMKQLSMDRDIRFAIISNAEEEELLQFLYANDLTDVEYYFGDEKALEAMLRSNPGFIVMHNATVRGKWHYKNAEKIKDFPFEIND